MRLDLAGNAEAIAALSPGKVAASAKTAVNRAGKSTSVEISRKIRAVYTLKARDIKETFKLEKLGPTHVQLIYKSKRPGLIKFKHSARVRRYATKTGKRARQRTGKSAVAVRVKKTDALTVHKTGFLGRAKNSGSLQVFERIPGTIMSSNPRKEKLRKLTGPSVPQLVSGIANRDDLQGFIQHRLDIEFTSALRAKLLRQRGEI